MLRSVSKGGTLTDEELQAWIDSSPELRDFQDRLIEHWGPGVKKIESSIEKVRVGIKKGKKNRFMEGKHMTVRC